MKKLFILFLFSYSFLNAQGPPVGTRWTYTRRSFSDYMTGQSVPISIEIDRDTVVHGKVLKHMTLSSSISAFYLFENRKVFQYYDKLDTFFLLYDWNKNTHDTVSITFNAFFLQNKKIDSLKYVIDSVKYRNSDSLKIQYVHTVAFSFNFTFSHIFIEKIGGDDWFFPQSGAVDPAQSNGIRCYEEPGKTPIKFVTYKCDSTLRTGTQDVLDDHNVQLYPTLVNQDIYLENSGNGRHEKYFIYITDALGRVILQTTWLEQETSKIIDANNWHSGIYFVTLRNESGARSTKKIIKIN